MKDPKDMSEAELDSIIEKETLRKERDPQLRIAEALEEIAMQLQTLNERLESTVATRLGAIADTVARR